MKQMARQFGSDLARAFGGAILFSFPILMTMETWWLGFSLPQWRIALFVAVALPILLGLNHLSGFRPTLSWFEDVIDLFVALLVGLVTAGLFLGIFGVMDWHLSFGDIVAQLGLLSVPCAFGAVLASTQLGAKRESNEGHELKRNDSYFRSLAVMAAGALYASFTVSPTEEMYLISYKMPPALILMLIMLSLLLIHAFLYGMKFGGKERLEKDAPTLSLFYNYTVVAYAIALGMSAYVLWTFGRLEGLSFSTALPLIIVLGFPSAIGAAVSRLVI